MAATPPALGTGVAAPRTAEVPRPRRNYITTWHALIVSRSAPLHLTLGRLQHCGVFTSTVDADICRYESRIDYTSNIQALCRYDLQVLWHVCGQPAQPQDCGAAAPGSRVQRQLCGWLKRPTRAGPYRMLQSLVKARGGIVNQSSAASGLWFQIPSAASVITPHNSHEKLWLGFHLPHECQC